MNTRCWLTFVAMTVVLSGTAALKAITLEEALQRTVDKNPAIQNAKHDLEKACGRRLIFRSIGLPDVVIGAAGGDQGGHRAGQKPNQPFGFGFGGLTQPLFNVAVPASFRRGNIEVLIALQQLNMAIVDQLYSARVSYYNGAYNRQLKQLTQDQRVHLEGNTSTQQARYQSGLAQRGALLGAEMQTRELDPRIEAADRAYQGAALSLADTMGDDLTGRFPLPQMESELKYSAVPVDAASATATTLALNQRADIKLARLMVKAAAEDERIMEAAYYPVVNGLLQGEYIPVSGVRRQSEGSVHRTDDIISSELREGAAYTWRVIDNGRVTGQVRQKRSAREINEILLKKMEADVPRDLARLQTSLDGITKNYSSISQAINSAQQTVAMVNQNVSGGVTSQLESRLAENASLETKTTLLNLAYQQNLAMAELDRVTGRYFQYSDDPSANTRKTP
jgi:outer membrane protein TolC